MKYYQHNEGRVFALDDDVDPKKHLPAGAREIASGAAVTASRAVAPAPAPTDYFAKRVMALRKSREVVLNRLMGTVVTFSTGQGAAKAACIQARQALLDLPQHNDLLLAQTPAELDAAIANHQVDIQAAMPEALHKVFAGIQL